MSLSLSDFCSCPDCSKDRSDSDSPLVMEEVPLPGCCDSTLLAFTPSTPIPTVSQCPSCLRLWEWCGTIEGKGVAILLNTNLEDADDIPDC